MNPTLLQPPQSLKTTQKDQPNQGNQTPTLNGREGFREGEGETGGGVRDERRPNPTKEPDPSLPTRQREERVRLGRVRDEDPTRQGTRPPPQRTERDSERGEVDLDELERRTGGQGWLEID